MPSPPRSLLRLAAPLIAGRGLSAVLSFAVPMVLARALSPTEYGTYKQIFLTAATCTLMAQLGIPASLYYFVPRAGLERGRYLLQALLALFAAGALAAAAVLGTAGELAYRFDNGAYAALAWPLAAYVLGTLGALPLEPALTALGRTGWAAAAYLASDVARMGALVAPVLLGAGLSALAWSAAAVALGRVAVVWTLALAGKLGTLRRPTRASVAGQARYCLPLGAAALLAVAQTQLPHYVVAAATDSARYAVFAVGTLQLPVVEMVYASLVEVMMVRLGAGPTRAPAVFREAVARLALFFLPLAALGWAVAPELIPALYTDTYAAAVPLFMIATAEIVVSTLPLEGLLRALGATRPILAVSALRLVVTAFAVPAGLFLHGLPGAMAAFVAVQLAAKAALLRIAAARLGVSAFGLLPGRVLAAWSGRSLVIYAVVAGLRALGPWRGWAFLGVAAGAAGALWLGLAAASGDVWSWRPAHEDRVGSRARHA